MGHFFLTILNKGYFFYLYFPDVLILNAFDLVLSCNFQTLMSHYDLIQIVSIFGILISALIGRKHLTLMYLISLFIRSRE